MALIQILGFNVLVEELKIWFSSLETVIKRLQSSWMSRKLWILASVSVQALQVFKAPSKSSGLSSSNLRNDWTKRKFETFLNESMIELFTEYIECPDVSTNGLDNDPHGCYHSSTLSTRVKWTTPAWTTSLMKLNCKCICKIVCICETSKTYVNSSWYLLQISLLLHSPWPD